MRLQVPILRTFEIGRPQIFAGVMLLVLAALALARSAQPDPGSFTSPDSVFMLRLQTAGQAVGRLLAGGNAPPASSSAYWLGFHTPFVLFGLWLGGALWWVTRRLYNNVGGYVSLGLYCSSPAVIFMSSRINVDLLAAWGLFGIVYTSIGVAHTLYAPPAKWKPRILLLGTAFGLTASAHLSAALFGLALATFFLLYLAPGRRLASIVILALSCAIALLILWAFHGFSLRSFAFDLSPALRWRWHPLFHAFYAISPLLLLLLVFCLLVLAGWARTRYFGNWAPLLVLAPLLLFAPAGGLSGGFWALPFLFVFVGGIFSDLIESSPRLAISLITLVIVMQLLAALLHLTRLTIIHN